MIGECCRWNRQVPRKQISSSGTAELPWYSSPLSWAGHMLLPESVTVRREKTVTNGIVKPFVERSSRTQWVIPAQVEPLQMA